MKFCYYESQKTKHSKRNLTLYNIIHHRSQIGWTRSEREPQYWEISSMKLGDLLARWLVINSAN